MSSLNKVTLIGNVGADPDIRSMQSGDKVANLSIATSEKWKDKNTGEQKEKTEWHRVSVFGKLAEVIEKYVKKGSKLYLEGQLETRSWEQDGQKKYTTEIILRGFGGSMIMLDGRSGGEMTPAPAPAGGHAGEMEDEIPFAKIPSEIFNY